MEAKVYNQKGKEVSLVKLPEEVFAVSPNQDLVHQVVISMMANRRAGTADSKTRGEVSGGGKKPWRQKGTGRARHGSTRSPIWKGGGVSHGPLAEKNYKKKINKKMKTLALYTILAEKFRDNEVLFVDQIKLGGIKTKEADLVVKNLAKIPDFEKLSYKKRNSFILMPAKDEIIEKSFSNLPSVKIGQITNLNILDLVEKKYLVLVSPEEIFNLLLKKKNKIT